ncbi:MAG: hypothetical protein WCP82_05060 [Alphaproteobacteria bacterium]
MTVEEQYRQALEEIRDRGIWLGGEGCERVAKNALEPPAPNPLHQIRRTYPPGEWGGLGK